MLVNAFLIALGVFIGWHIPQPQWVKDLTAKAKARFEELMRED
jgi:hypothetical protein